ASAAATTGSAIAAPTLRAPPGSSSSVDSRAVSWDRGSIGTSAVVEDGLVEDGAAEDGAAEDGADDARRSATSSPPPHAATAATMASIPTAAATAPRRNPCPDDTTADGRRGIRGDDRIQPSPTSASSCEV